MIRVDLPDPVVPTIPTISPFSMVRFTSRKTFFDLSKAKLTCENSIFPSIFDGALALAEIRLRFGVENIHNPLGRRNGALICIVESCKEVYGTVEKSGVGEERNKRTERKRRGIVNDILTAYQPDKDTSVFTARFIPAG